MKKLLLASVALSVLTACAVGPDFIRPAAPDVKRLTDTDMPDKTASADNRAGAAQSFVHNKDLPKQWWTLFQSDQLNALMAQAIAANPDLQSAKASLKQAKELMLAERGELLPQVDATAGATRQRISPAAFGSTGPGSVFNLYNASVQVSYGVDLFGATRRDLEALQAQVNYERYEVEAAYLTLTSNVATAAIQEASLREQIKETKAIITLQREQMDLLNKQFELGAIAKTTLLEQQALVAQTETTLPPLEKLLAQQRNYLAVLAGKVPGEGIEQTFDLTSLHLPEELPISLPSELVNQRPDIRAAEELSKAANAQIGIATAAMLPQVTLSGAYGGTSQSFSSVWTPETMVWNLGANLLQPVFHGGELLHAKRAKVAAFDKANADYRSTVLRAFQNVADTLRALQYDADALASNVRAEHAAAESYNLSRSQYEAGAVTYSQTLDIQRTWQQTRIGLVQAQAARYADTVALFQALGGEWSKCDAPPATPVAPVTAPAAVVAPVIAEPVPAIAAEPVAQPATDAPVQTSPLALTAPKQPAPETAPAPFIALPPANSEPQSLIKEEKKP